MILVILFQGGAVGNPYLSATYVLFKASSLHTAVSLSLLLDTTKINLDTK